MAPPRMARKMFVMSVETPARGAPPYNSGVTRSPARFAAPRGRGGDRSVGGHRAELAGPPKGLGAAGAGGGGAVGRMGAVTTGAGGCR